ncbi:MAG: ABC transporter permease [Kiritimatiellae bacterium]|nr:ABC transporter permease [Kiritimatiellia bacterium]
MTVVREPMWDDAPRSRAQGVVRHLTKFLASLGWAFRIMTRSAAAFPSVVCRSRGREDLVRQLYVSGIRTLPVVTIVSVFIGMILALQVGLELRRFNQEIYLGAAVMVSLIREMGPFACGMCLAACVGSSIAAELGTMKVNDEIAALEIMSISPIRFLAAPRILALVLVAPLLSFYCCIVGAMGGGLVGVTQLGVDFDQYIASAMSIADVKDLYVGLLKATLFGLTIGTVSVAEGFGTTLGATGVGKSTQRSVIVSFLLILMFGYMVTRACYR